MTEVAHVTRDSDTTFRVKRSKVNLQGQGHIVAASRLQLVIIYIDIIAIATAAEQQLADAAIVV